jgi:hypothetical protein
MLLLFQTPHALALDSNKWPVFVDKETGLRISYPPSWEIVPNKGPNVKISFSPKDGPGNCNVVAQPLPEINDYSQEVLNKEIEHLPLNFETWESLLNMPRSKFSIIEQKRVSANQVSAIYGILEVKADSLSGAFFMKKMVAFMLTPGKRWAVTGGVSTYDSSEGRTRFTHLQPYLSKVFESFIFLNTRKVNNQQPESIKSASIEYVASQIAYNHNQNAQNMLDAMTSSSSAKAVGKNVIFTNVLRVRKGLSKSELKQFQTELYNEIVPKVCTQNSENEAFKKGLYYTFVYKSIHGENLARIKIDMQTCKE